MVNTPLFTGLYTSQVVQDIFHQRIVNQWDIYKDIVIWYERDNDTYMYIKMQCETSIYNLCIKNLHSDQYMNSIISLWSTQNGSLILCNYLVWVQSSRKKKNGEETSSFAHWSGFSIPTPQSLSFNLSRTAKSTCAAFDVRHVAPRRRIFLQDTEWLIWRDWF